MVTHAELVGIAGEWLWARGCEVVITEMASAAREIPDAIGWRRGRSVLVECKASKSDFKAEAKNKIFRQVDYLGIGYARYYLAPRGLLTESDIPSGWGLLEAGSLVEVAKRCEPWPERNMDAEIRLLLTAVRRMGKAAVPGVCVRFYTKKAKTATLGVLDDCD